MSNKAKIIDDIFTIMLLLDNRGSDESGMAILRAAEEIGFENLPIKLLLAFRKHLMSGE